MRIFQLCNDRGIPWAGSKGASIHLRSLARAFHQEGHEVHGFVRRGEAAALHEEVLVHPLNALQDLLQAAQRHGPPDLIYERYALGSTLGLLAARRLACPFVLEVNAPLVAETRQHRPACLQAGDDTVERRLFEEADLVTAVSRPLARLIKEVRGQRRPLLINPNGCNPDLFLKKTPPAARRQGRLIFLGHPKPWHGAVGLVALLRALLARQIEAHLLVVGGGPGAGLVLREAQGAGVIARVQTTGPLNQDQAVTALLSGSLLVAPYPKQEPFYFSPLKIIEAMAAGLPVVTTAQGDLPWLLGGGGVAVPPEDGEALVMATASLLLDGRRRRTMGKRGRARALSRFTWRAQAQRVLAAVARHLFSKAR